MGIDLGKFEAFGDIYMKYRGHYIKTEMTFEKAKEIFDKKQNENNELKKQNSQLEAKLNECIIDSNNQRHNYVLEQCKTKELESRASKLQSEIDKCNKVTTILMGSEYHDSPSTVITELQNMVRDFQEQMAKSITRAKESKARIKEVETGILELRKLSGFTSSDNEYDIIFAISELARGLNLPESGET